MESLRTAMKALPFDHVQTYIQTGNIIFDCADTDVLALANSIHEVVQKDFGFDVPIIVLTVPFLQGVFGNSPFLNGRAEDITKLSVSFLKEQPTLEDAAALRAMDCAPDEIVIADHCVYSFCPNGFARANIENNIIERKLKVRATARNWKTVTKLVTMATS